MAAGRTERPGAVKRPRQSSPAGPQSTFTPDWLPLLCRASRQAQPARGSCCGGRPGRPTALRCSPRGRAAELTALAAQAPFRQLRRVSLRSALRAPTPALRCSSPQKSPPAGCACRAARRRVSNGRAPAELVQRGARVGCGAPVRRRVAQGSRPRAQRASSSDSARLSERSLRSKRSELRAGPRDRATQGSPRAAGTAAPKRCGLPGRPFAARCRSAKQPVTVCNGPRAVSQSHPNERGSV